jgi:hypothetical protein
MAQKIDIRIDYGEGREMGYADKVGLQNLLKGSQIVSADVSADGSVVSFRMKNRAKLAFRMDLAVPTVTLDLFPDR